MRSLSIGAVLALLCVSTSARAWEEVAFLPWGDGPGEVGLTEVREDELQRGPHGIAVDTAGNVAVIDRVNGRALVVGRDGAVGEPIPLPGHPGPALLLDDGTVAVVDERDERRVRRTGAEADEQLTPRWTLPPHRLVARADGNGGTVIEGLNPFQLRLPLLPRFEHEPAELPRGVPSADGSQAVTVVRRDGELHVDFGGGPVAVAASIWPAAPGAGAGPGAVSVLAVERDRAVVAVESVGRGDGPIVVTRAVAVISANGAHGELLVLPDPGPVLLPAALAATPSGAVYLLVSGQRGCHLLRAEVAP
jgi:hypothetical protein